MKTILGTGQLGVAVMEELLRRNPNEEILMANRRGILDIQIPKSVKIIAADVTDIKALESISKKSEVIFSCTDVPYPSWGEFYPAAASALAYALSRTNARLVFADNMYSYGNVKGKVMHESMPHNAKTVKGSIRSEVINTLLKSGDLFNRRVAVVKAADFIGPRIHKGVFGEDFIKRLNEGKSIILPASIKLPHTFTYVNDFATAIVNVGACDDTFGQIWHTPNAPAMSLEKWIHLFEVMTGKKAKIVRVPKIGVWVAGFFDALVKEYRELTYQFEYPYLVDHSKYAARFGESLTSPSSIVKETVRWYNTINKVA